MENIQNMLCTHDSLILSNEKNHLAVLLVLKCKVYELADGTLLAIDIEDRKELKKRFPDASSPSPELIVNVAREIKAPTSIMGKWAMHLASKKKD